jgi:hypothetical protein
MIQDGGVIYTDDIYNCFSKELYKLGYTALKPDHRVYLESTEFDSEDNNKKIEDFFGIDLYDRIVKHNKRIEDER